MITPEDIQSKEFGKAVRGYREEEVDQFLDDLTLDYEAVLRENEQLKLELSELQDKYKDQEESIYYTLQSAKQLMSDISKSAERRAEILLKNAQLDADNLTRQTKSSLIYLQEQEAAMKNRVFKLKAKIKNILEAELEDINTIELDFFNEEIPNTVDKLMSYSAEFDGFFGGEEETEEIAEENRKTIMVAAPAKAAVSEEPEEIVHTAEDIITEAETPAEAEEAAEEAAAESETVMDIPAEAAETTEEIASAEAEFSQEEEKSDSFMNDFIFTLSDEVDSEEE